MKKRLTQVLGLVLAITALVVAASPSQGAEAASGNRSYLFTTIDFPNASKTLVMGNNSRSDLVGYYAGTDKVDHGFLLRGGVFATLDFPGSDVAWTQATAINDAGDIAGAYSLKSPAPAGNVHAFLRTAAGEWSNVDYPEGTHIMQGGAYGILADRTVVGCFHDGVPATAMFGYIKGPQGASASNYPAAAPFSMHWGGTPDGKTIVGAYLEGANQPGNWHGYLLAGGKLILFDFPGRTGTNALGVGPTRDVVGTFKVLVDKAWITHGFVAETSGSDNTADWRFTAVDVPGASQTFVRAINAGGDLAGYYFDASGVAHGYLGKVAAPTGSSPGGPAPLPPATGAGLAHMAGGNHPLPFLTRK